MNAPNISPLEAAETAPNIPLAVRELVAQYRRYLRTSYRFLDPQLRAQFERQLAETDAVVRGPYVTLARDFQAGRTLAAIIAAGDGEPELARADWAFGASPLYRHQEQALAAGRAGRSFAVTTGTGSGKTEAFLLPVLDGILRAKRRGAQGVQAILLYPMNALANDQLERLRRLLPGPTPGISYGLYTGDSDKVAAGLETAPGACERTTREAMRRTPPDILLTNYKQLEFLLVRREDRAFFSPALRYLVLDEIHSYQGALACEIAYLIRRLKLRCGKSGGGLVGIGTSATVAGATGAEALAKFAAALLAEPFAAEDVIAETLAPAADESPYWEPPPPELTAADLDGFDAGDEERVLHLAERLSGRQAPAGGGLPARITELLRGNALVGALERELGQPQSPAAAAARLQAGFRSRAAQPLEAVGREIEAYLLVASISDEHTPPRLRPKLHLFFHGIYDVGLCLNPACRTLVRHGDSVCPACGAQARPAALCRTCGQDFVKLRAGEDPARPLGNGDLGSGPENLFWTHAIHQLPEAAEATDDEEDGAAAGAAAGARRRVPAARGKLEAVGVCPRCGRVTEVGAECSDGHGPTTTMQQIRGKLSTCPACGDAYTRGDIVTLLRTGTASSASVLVTHHLDRLRGRDRKLLLFTDNRQDAAHQAGYTADKHRAFALRHVVVDVIGEQAEGVALTELPQRLFDRYLELGLTGRKRPTQAERAQWLLALGYLSASEFTRYSRSRLSLETLGLAAVEYEFLDRVAADARFAAAAAAAGLELDAAALLTRAILDVMRKERALALPYFQEYINPERQHRYRSIEEEPFGVRFPERDRSPQAFALDRPDHIRKSGHVLGFYQENPHTGQLTAVHKLAERMIGNRGQAALWLCALVPILQEHELLTRVDRFPIPAADRVQSLSLLQIDPRVVRLVRPTGNGFRCNACQTWRPYQLGTCPTPRCRTGDMQAAQPDPENYYVRLYLDHALQPLRIAEHSAQIGGEERARLESDFKADRVQALVCTPTLELGVDIGQLLTVALRNAPPSPANYAQRVGRAGRRLRIGFASTFCASGAHDRHAFSEPEWLIAGQFDPPLLRLDNARIAERHLRSCILESVEAQLPAKMGELLDDIRTPTGWKRERLDELFAQIRAGRARLAERLEQLLAADRTAGRPLSHLPGAAAELVDRFEPELTAVLERWFERIRQLDAEYRMYATVGSPRHDERKAAARKRAYFEITQSTDRAYALGYLATQGLLPAYQFPLDTFSLDPGVADTPTLYRPSAIAIEEFAPGNFVYANGHKLRSIRVLFPGGPGGGSGHSDAEASGRLQSYHFCAACGEAAEAPRNCCPRCGAELPTAVDALFVEAFEAEENVRISAEEEARERAYQDRRESLLLPPGAAAQLFPYPLAPLEHIERAEILVTNWGRRKHQEREGARFLLCPECGRHQPHDEHESARAAKLAADWQANHARFCRGLPLPLILAYKFQTPSLVLSLPHLEAPSPGPGAGASDASISIMEALLAGARELLELRSGDLAAYAPATPPGQAGAQIVFYETTPGGSGYLAQVAARLPEVAEAAQRVLFGHTCGKACYLCLKHYRNQWRHGRLNKQLTRDFLANLALTPPHTAEAAASGEGLKRLESMQQERAAAPSGKTYTKGFIEEPLLAALRQISSLPEPLRDYEVRRDGEVLTVPDFAWPNERLAVYCDGYAFHGGREALEGDAGKRNWLQAQGWVVLTYWGRIILADPARCAAQVAECWHARARDTA